MWKGTIDKCHVLNFDWLLKLRWWADIIMPTWMPCGTCWLVIKMAMSPPCQAIIILSQPMKTYAITLKSDRLIGNPDMNPLRRYAGNRPYAFTPLAGLWPIDKGNIGLLKFLSSDLVRITGLHPLRSYDNEVSRASGAVRKIAARDTRKGYRGIGTVKT